MPIYEYRAVRNGCQHCKRRFEVRQGINAAPLAVCPHCGAPVKRLFSRPYICVIEPLSEKDKLVKRSPEEADRQGLIEGFAEDRIYD